MIVNFFKNELPKFIVHNDFNKHKYLFPIFLAVAITGFAHLIWLEWSDVYSFMASFGAVAVYYVVLTYQCLNDFNFDTRELNLSSEAQEVLDGTTQVWRNRITFYLHKITKDRLEKYTYDEKLRIVKEIKEATYPRNFSGSVIFMGDYLYVLRDSGAEVDIEFLLLLLRELNLSVQFSQISNFKEIGVEFSQLT